MIAFVKFSGILMLLCWGCSEQIPKKMNSQVVWTEISGRDEGKSGPRPVIYRVKVPIEWKKRVPLQTESIFDSTKPLIEFFINEESNSIRITIHNFPTDTLEERVPPAAQLTRWKQQFDYIDESLVDVQPIASGGFAGLFFEAVGVIGERELKVLGWSMQLAAEHYLNLNYHKQMRSDYTIKVVGSKELVDKHKLALINFANSFELIEEIPTRL